MSTIELRPASADDLVSMCELVVRSEHHDGVERVLSLEELREDFERPYVDLAEDARLALIDGDLAGWAWVYHAPSTERLERAYILGDVDPAHRGKGIGRQLLGWGVDRATHRLQGAPPGLPRYIRVHAYDTMTADLALMARFGFTPVRWFEELLRPLDGLPAPVVPDGVTLLAWPEDRDEEIRLVRNAAFADHWGTTPADPAGWEIAVRGHGARPDLSVVAIDDATGAVVASCLNHAYPEDDEVTGRRDAWIDNLATLRAWRGRGLASAMIAWSLVAFRDAGFTHAMIEVDADNPTGAARLYRALGFEVQRRSVTSEIEVV